MVHCSEVNQAYTTITYNPSFRCFRVGVPRPRSTRSYLQRIVIQAYLHPAIPSHSLTYSDVTS